MSKPNFENRTIWTGDNLSVMRGINSECVDLIYLDPPFLSENNFTVSIGSEVSEEILKDAWGSDEDTSKADVSEIDVYKKGELADRIPAVHAVIKAADHASGNSMKSYLIFMAVRLLEMHRILKKTGSIYLHCDPTTSHYLKTLMDAIFGKEQFINEIVWCYTGHSNAKKFFKRKHDIILYYSANGKWTFNGGEVKALGASSNGGEVITEDWWTDIPPASLMREERLGYPTQKPLALLDRIIRASSNKGDTVLDPFCGCATTLVAAEKLERQWAGIDISPLAVDLVEHRMKIENSSPWEYSISKKSLPQQTDAK